MRPIKFRAWEKPGAVPHGNGWFDGKMHEVIPNHLNSFFDYCLSRSHEYELLQFTGLLDKNGKEIYEGDIVKHQMAGITEVEWLNVGWTPFMSYHAGELYEVIGNIYENPELLNQKPSE